MTFELPTFALLQGMTALAHVELRLAEGARGRGQYDLEQEHTAIRDMLRRRGRECEGRSAEGEGPGVGGRGLGRAANRVRALIRMWGLQLESVQLYTRYIYMYQYMSDVHVQSCTCVCVCSRCMDDIMCMSKLSPVPLG